MTYRQNEQGDLCDNVQRDRESWVALYSVTGDSLRLEKVFFELRCSFNGSNR